MQLQGLPLHASACTRRGHQPANPHARHRWARDNQATSTSWPVTPDPPPATHADATPGSLEQQQKTGHAPNQAAPSAPSATTSATTTHSHPTSTTSPPLMPATTHLMKPTGPSNTAAATHPPAPPTATPNEHHVDKAGNGDYHDKRLPLNPHAGWKRSGRATTGLWPWLLITRASSSGMSTVQPHDCEAGAPQRASESRLAPHADDPEPTPNRTAWLTSAAIAWLTPIVAAAPFL